MSTPFYTAQPAFPHSPDVIRDGLTKREYFAGLAMQGLLANEQTKPSGMSHDADQVARRAVQHADALLAELAK